MSKVITVANQKGGVGKSTSACNLAVCAVKDGKNVLIIDADVQGSSISFRAVRELDDLKAISIIKPTIHKDIKAFDSFDVIIIDAGGKDDELFRSSILAAIGGLVLIPILPSQYDVWATEDTLKVIEFVKVGYELDACAVFNQTIQNTIVSQEARVVLEELAEKSDVKILETTLFSRVDYKKSISLGQSVEEYAPKGKAAMEIGSLYAEIKNILNI